MHPADPDYTRQNEPNPEQLDAMMMHAEHLASLIGGDPGRRWAQPSMTATCPAQLLPPESPPPPLSEVILTLPPVAPVGGPSPLLSALERERQYQAAREAAEAQAQTMATLTLDAGAITRLRGIIGRLEEIADEIEADVPHSDVLASAVATLRLATLGFIRVAGGS